MKRLTEAQKAAIRNYRGAGLGYKAIAGRMALSRETVRSFCSRNDIQAKPDGGARTSHILWLYFQKFVQLWKGQPSDGQSIHGDHCDALSGDTGNTTEYKMGNTVFAISTSYSENASETLEKKLEKLILDDASRQSRGCCFVRA